MATGTKVTARDLESGESESTTIVDDYVLICDGDVYLDAVEHHNSGASHHPGGVTVLTIRRR